jgi:hypothetical protein
MSRSLLRGDGGAGLASLDDGDPMPGTLMWPAALGEPEPPAPESSFSRGCAAGYSPRNRASSASAAGERSATVTRYPHAVNQGVLSFAGQIGQQQIDDRLLMYGDVGCHHRRTQSGIPRGGLGAAGQHEPSVGRQALHCLAVVGTPQPPWLSALVSARTRDSSSDPGRRC